MSYTIGEIQELEKRLNIPDGINMIEYIMNLEDFKNETVSMLTQLNKVINEVNDLVK